MRIEPRRRPLNDQFESCAGMKLTRTVIENPIAGYVILLFFVVFGAVSLSKLPVQLTPEITEPEITITTTWRAAAPEEIESEIIEPQEDALKGLPGVVKMLSSSQRGQGSITLSFDLGISMERALIEVLNRLNRVSSYPVDADEPVLNTLGEAARPIAWFIIKPAPGNTNHIATYKRFVEETVQARFERVWGVSESEVRGGLEREVRITIDPYRAASLGINLPQAVNLVRGQEDISGGMQDVGKRSYTVRFEGAYDVSGLPEMILEWRDGRPIRLRDVADVALRHEDMNSFVINDSERAIAVNAYRESGVNVIEVMQRLQEAATALSEGPLKRAGLRLDQVYDETVYIEKAVELLFSNLLAGIVLAGIVLWWFSRRLRLILIVAAGIPISLFAALIVLQLTGRTLNVISLAALALAVGMVLDASIIAIENILRLREAGRSFKEAAIEGTDQVKQALIASTATTVAIFLPILLLKGEAGQMFAELAIGLSSAIVISLFVALILAPALSCRWLTRKTDKDPFAPLWDKLSLAIMRLIATKRRRRIWITALFAVPITLIVLLIPKADYLPQGSRNLVFAFLLTPPSMNVPTMEKEIGGMISEHLKPYTSGETSPKIKQYFFVAFPRGAFMGARTEDPNESEQLVPLMNDMFRDVPDTLAFARRASLFSRGNTRSVEMNLQARDIVSLLSAAYTGYGLIAQEIPFARVNPKPGLELSESQLLLLPKEDRIAEVGWNRETVGMVTRAIGDGLYITDYFDGDKKLDVIGRISGWQTVEDLASIPLMTPAAGVLPFGELVAIERAAGPDQIRRLDRRRTITLEVIAPPFLSLEETIELLQEKIEPKLMQQLPEDAAITYGGSADKLKSALSGMSDAFLLAVLILYLLISVLFHSFRDSVLVIVSLPLAIVGSVLALQLINLVTFQPMDMLTMIGFIILLGLVVNNAILLVHQTREAERQGATTKEAVHQAIRIRLRPILMSTLTSLFGMLPLLLAFGSGAELYRGMAAVIVGGLSLSTLFTLILLPCLLAGRKPSKRPVGAVSS